jgi:DNA primase
MPGVDFQKLRDEIAISEVLQLLDFRAARRSGSQLRGPCPVHGSKTPDSTIFSVNLELGRYYCHKCKSKGNQLELWAAVTKLSIYDASLDLCKKLHKEIPWIKRY